MTKQSVPAVGIDLGTTFSVLARLDENGQPVTLVNAEGDRITPSMVLFDGEDVVVGKEALKALPPSGPRGRVRQTRHGPPRLPQGVQGKQYPPEVIEAFILNKLRRDAAAADRAVRARP